MDVRGVNTFKFELLLRWSYKMKPQALKSCTSLVILLYYSISECVLVPRASEVIKPLGRIKFYQPRVGHTPQRSDILVWISQAGGL